MATPQPPTGKQARPIKESAAVLAGTAVNGLGAYLYIAVGTRAYGDEAMAPIAVLWTFWAVSVALFTFPIQHWAIRKISVDGHTRGVGASVGRLALLVIGVAGAMAVSAGMAGERLFGSSGIWWPLLVFLITIGSAFVGLQRGVLAGRGRYYATAANIAAENILRLTLGIIVAITVDSILVFGWVLALGPLVALFWPEAVRLPFRSGIHEPTFRFLGGLAGGILIAQIILNAGPVVLQGLGAPESEVTGLFLALALFRAPYLLALGVATRITAPLTGLVVGGHVRRVRQIVTLTGIGSFLLAAIGGAVGYLIGPWTIDLVFAPETEPSAPVLAFISAGSMLALGGLGLILVLIAQHRTLSVQVAWLAGLVAAVLVLVLWPGDETPRVVAAFVIAEAVAVAAMLMILLIGKPAAAPDGDPSVP